MNIHISYSRSQLIHGFSKGFHRAAIRCFWLVLGATMVQAASLDVCPSSCTYATIPEAVNAEGGGDTIEIGRWAGPLNL